MHLQSVIGNQAVQRLLSGAGGPFQLEREETTGTQQQPGLSVLATQRACCAGCQDDDTDESRPLSANRCDARVQRTPSDYDPADQRKLIEDGIRDKDIGKIKSVEENAYQLASDSQAIDMILILLNQGWVGPRDELSIYQIWNSRGKGVVDLASKYTFVWNMCLDRGVDTLWSIPDLAPIKTEFKQVVAARARGFLDDNKKTVEAELKRYGLDDMGGAPAPEKAQEREKMMAAAVAVKKAKDAIEQMDHMLVGYNHVVGTPEDNKTEQCAAMFNPAVPPPLPGHVPVPAEEGAVLPSWDETRKNYERAHSLVDHYTRLYPALVALREDTDLNDVAKGAVSSEEPAENLMAMQVLRKALGDTESNIDKTYGLVNDPKGEFALELQPIHEQLFTSDAAWRDPFRQMVARDAIKEHGDVEFWKTMGVAAVGMALFVVAEFATGGLATFFFAAAAAGSIAQAAASWDKYFTLEAAANTNMSPETSLISRDQASDQLLTAALDTVMAFVDGYAAATGGAEALAKVNEAEAKLAGVAGKEAVAVSDEMKAARVEVGGGHEVGVTGRGIERCSPTPCPVIVDFWENSLERHPDLKARLDRDAQMARTDPVWAARDASSTDRALQNITELEVEQWAAGIPAEAAADTPKFTDLKRLPEERADIANRPLTPEQLKVVQSNVEEMKAAGRLPEGYEFKSPSIPGALIAPGVAQKAMEVIGTKITDNPAVAACWKDAADSALANQALTADNYEKLYKSAQGRFWNRVGNDPTAKAYFVEHGFTVDGKGAAYLDVEGVSRQEVSLGLDHTFPKATGDNYKYALDGDKLQFLMQADNTKLSHLETKDPTLRR